MKKDPLVGNNNNNNKNLLQRKLQSQVVSLENYIKLARKIVSIVYKLSQKIEEETTSQFLKNVASPILIPKPDKDIMRRQNHRPISLMNRHKHP